MKFTFKKSERLNSKKVIERLFDKKGSEQIQSVFHYPFRVSYAPIFDVRFSISDLEVDEETNPKSEIEDPKIPQILISVSKRSFKRAVDRNLIKRRIREAYRLNKYLLLQKPAHQIPAYIAFVYIAKTIEDFTKIEKSMKGVFQKIG